MHRKNVKPTEIDEKVFMPLQWRLGIPDARRPGDVIEAMYQCGWAFDCNLSLLTVVSFVRDIPDKGPTRAYAPRGAMTIDSDVEDRKKRGWFALAVARCALRALESTKDGKEG